MFYKIRYLLKHKKTSVTKFTIGLCLVLCAIVFFANSAFALSTSTYSDVTSSGSTVNTLLSLIPDRGSGKYDYLVFTNSSDSYYCFYGNDFEINNNVISASDCQYIHYYRLGQTYSYTYDFGSQNLSLTVNNIVCSNLDLQKASNSFSFDEYQNNMILYVSAIIIAVFIIFSCLRGWFRGGSFS